MADPIIIDYAEFPVSRYGNRDKPSSFKPMLNINIDEHKTIPCLLDSGADLSASFKEVGELWFGLKFLPEERIPNNMSGFLPCPDKQCGQHPDKAPAYSKSIDFKVKDIP